MDYIKGAATLIALLLALVILLNKLWLARRSSYNSNSVDNASRQLDSVASSSDSAESNPLPLPIGEYEVFLNFRGPDTRHQVTDILYRFLINLKIRTFKDDDELRKGEGIWPSLVKAIEQSKIYVPIFSENYAYSKWCLKELAAIVERQEQDRGCIILPIFYMVDPRDVRHQSGRYHNAFEEHRKNFDEHTIRVWKDALKKVGALKGWHVKSSNEQGAIADIVTSTVWEHLRKNNYALETGKLIGIDDHIVAVQERMSLDSGGVSIVGIHGIGGIGKTTIAKAVYNKVFARFDRCVFVENVREMLQQKDGVINLQKKIISNMLNANSISNHSEVIGIIRDRISRFKCLIVLDDVDEEFEFNEVLGNIKNFVSGSSFIITSRNVKVLSSLTEECRLYKVRGMSSPQALQLFCEHAFKRDFPPSNYETLSKDIVDAVAGLPLTLKVVGSLLFQEDEVIWEDKLRQLKEIPEKKVVERLKISYDTLNEEAQQIFLDIACFFIGQNKEMPSYMWSDRGLFPTTNINILYQRSMIEVVFDHDDNTHVFQMHDQLRDMGREIVRLESPRHPWQRSRIWSKEKALDMLLNKKGTSRVEGIRLHDNYFEEKFGKISKECFINLSELRYLDIEVRMLIDDFSNYVPNLSWLRFSIESSKCIPKFGVENLVILEVTSRVRDDLGGLRHIKMASKLKVLKLSGYRLDKFPEFPRSGSLEILDMGNWYQRPPVKDLDIGNLGNLKVLRLWDHGVRKITGGMMPKMRHDLLASTLTILHIECAKLEWLPNLENLGNLTDLSINGCPSLKEILGLGGLKSLETLRLCALKAVCNLDGLDRLYSLTSLKVSSCDALITLPSMASLSKLLHLTLSYCHSLTEIQGLGGLKSLQGLLIDDANSLTLLHSFETLLSYNTLEILTIRNCPLLTALPVHDNLEAVPVLDSLRELCICGTTLVLPIFCRMIQLLKFPSLTELTLMLAQPGTSMEFWLDGLESMESLVGLRLDDLDSLRRLPSLSKLGNLKRLIIDNVPKLQEIEGLAGLKSLEELQLTKCTGLKRLPVDQLSGLQQLKSLDITGSTNLIDRLALKVLEPKVRIQWPDYDNVRSGIRSYGTLRRTHVLKYASRSSR